MRDGLMRETSVCVINHCFLLYMTGLARRCRIDPVELTATLSLRQIPNRRQLLLTCCVEPSPVDWRHVTYTPQEWTCRCCRRPRASLRRGGLGCIM